MVVVFNFMGTSIVRKKRYCEGELKVHQLISGSMVKFTVPAIEYKGEEKFVLFDQLVRELEEDSHKELAESTANNCSQIMQYLLEILDKVIREDGKPVSLPSFTIMPYDHLGIEGDDKDVEFTPEGYNKSKPNFYYKPTGLKVWWYDYPLRSAELSQDIPLSTFEQILCSCKGELEEIIKEKLARASRETKQCYLLK